MHSKSSRDERWFRGFIWRGKPNFHKHLKRMFPSAIGMWEGTWLCCLKWNGHQDALTRKKAGFPWSGLNAGSSFIWPNEGMSESPVETLEKALGPCLIWTGGFTSLWHLKRHAEFNGSKGDDAWLLLKIDRNPNITVATRKGPWVSRLTLRSVWIYFYDFFFQLGEKFAFLFFFFSFFLFFVFSFSCFFSLLFPFKVL